MHTGLAQASDKPAYSVTQLCLTLCNPMDCSPSSIHRIFQTRILARVAVSSFRRSSQPRDLSSSPNAASLALADRFFNAELPGKPRISLVVKKCEVPSKQSTGNQFKK